MVCSHLRTHPGQITCIAHQARTALRISGALFVPVSMTRRSPAKAERMAATVLTTPMVPKVRYRSHPFTNSLRVRKSATTQLSKTPESRLMLIPPRTRLRNSTGVTGTIAARQEQPNTAQYTTQVVFRPNLSASTPTKAELMAADANCVMNSVVIRLALRAYSSLNKEYRHTFFTSFKLVEVRERDN